MALKDLWYNIPENSKKTGDGSGGLAASWLCMILQRKGRKCRASFFSESEEAQKTETNWSCMAVQAAASLGEVMPLLERVLEARPR